MKAAVFQALGQPLSIAEVELHDRSATKSFSRYAAAAFAAATFT